MAMATPLLPLLVAAMGWCIPAITVSVGYADHVDYADHIDASGYDDFGYDDHVDYGNRGDYDDHFNASSHNHSEDQLEGAYSGMQIFVKTVLGKRITLDVMASVGACLPPRGALTAPDFIPWAPPAGDQPVAATGALQPRSSPPEYPAIAGNCTLKEALVRSFADEVLTWAPVKIHTVAALWDFAELLDHQDGAPIRDQDAAQEEPPAGGAREVLRLLAFGVVVEVGRWAVSNERLSCGVPWPFLIRFAM